MSTLSRSREALNAIKAALSARADSWVNLATGLGGSRDKSRSLALRDLCVLTHQELEILFDGNDLAARIVEALPEEAFREGFTVADDALQARVEAWDLAGKAQAAAIWGRLFGGAAIYIGASDRLGPQDTPLRDKDVRKGDLVCLTVLTAQELHVLETDLDGRPRMYSAGRKAGEHAQGTPIHPSRLILFGGARTTERRRRAIGGWDLSVLQRPIEVLQDTHGAWRSVMHLLQDLSQAVFKIKDLTGMITDGRKSVIMDRMEIVDMGRSVARAVVLDADSESFETVGAQNVTGVDPLLMRVFQRLAAAAKMPVTVLMGMSPAGLNATGESDLRIWYAAAESARRGYTPAVIRAVNLIARHEGLQPVSSIKWPPLWILSDKERAEIEGLEATADATRITSQVLAPEEVALHRYGGKTWAEAVDVEGRGAALETPEDPDPSALETTDAEDPITVGSRWTDTQDGAVLQVTAVTDRHVYYHDLSSDAPGRQWRWVRGSFEERCMPAPAETGAGAEPAA